MRRMSRADLMLLVTVCLWGFNVTVTKYVLTHGFRPLAYSAVRYGGAALLFCGVTYGLERTLRVRRRDLPLLLLAAGLGVWLNQLSFMYAVKLTTATTVGLVLGTIPIFTALIARVLGVERLSRRFWLASAVSFGGVALVAAGSDWGAPSALGWLGLAFAVLGQLVLTNVLWFTAIDEVGPSRATLVANLQPFVAAIFALALLSERITLLQILGGVAIGVGILLSRGRPRRPAAVPEVEEERVPTTKAAAR